MNSHARIFYVEDDESLAWVTTDQLRQKGYELAHFANGRDALDAFASGDYDLCLLDVMLPRMDGFELARRIRRRDAHIPILFLTAKSMKEDRLRGFELGGDDYITKPFSVEELVMKIEVFLRRSQITGAAPDYKSSVPIGAYTFDPANMSLERDGQLKQLTERERDVLSYLAARPGELIPRSEILKDIWGKDDYFYGRSLDVFISKLRKYLGGDPAVSIENVHGVGFRLRVGGSRQ